MYDVLGGKLPLQRSGSRVERVNVAIAAAEIDAAVKDCRRGEEEVPRVGNCLIFRQSSVNAFRLKSPLVLRGETPFQSAAGCVQRVEASVVATEINYPIRHCGG